MTHENERQLRKQLHDPSRKWHIEGMIVNRSKKTHHRFSNMFNVFWYDTVACRLGEPSKVNAMVRKEGTPHRLLFILKKRAARIDHKVALSTQSVVVLRNLNIDITSFLGAKLLMSIRSLIHQCTSRKPKRDVTSGRTFDPYKRRRHLEAPRRPADLCKNTEAICDPPEFAMVKRYADRREGVKPILNVLKATPNTLQLTCNLSKQLFAL
ncbi:MAG: hypothetical protein AMXMBFR20_24050 [Planctomycetia bacterium]